MLVTLPQWWNKRSNLSEIADVSCGGLCAKVIKNGAQIFVPFSSLHDNKEEMEYRQEELALYIKGEKSLSDRASGESENSPKYA